MKAATRFLLMISVTSLPVSGAEIIAHRGASYDAPENTLPAVRLAWQRDADAVEIDIHVSKDGKIVVIHDDNTKRTAGVDRKVSEQTLPELRSFDAGLWKGPQWRGARIPTLEEIIAAIPPGEKLFVEIKCGPEVLPELQSVIEASGKKRQIVVIGFSFAVVATVKKRMPQLPVYWLFGFSEREMQAHGSPGPDELIAKAGSARLDGLDLNYRGPISEQFVEKIHKAGMKLYVYTVNSPQDARHLVRLGVDGITTDRPGWLRKALSEGMPADTRQAPPSPPQAQ